MIDIFEELKEWLNKETLDRIGAHNYLIDIASLAWVKVMGFTGGEDKKEISHYGIVLSIDPNPIPCLSKEAAENAAKHLAVMYQNLKTERIAQQAMIQYGAIEKNIEGVKGINRGD